jgi:two-component system chemotaxis response regulator CheY
VIGEGKIDSFLGDIRGIWTVGIVITNIHMPGMNGLDLTKRIRDPYGLDVITTTGDRESCTHEDAIRCDTAELFYKPFKQKDLLKSVNRILDK